MKGNGAQFYILAGVILVASIVGFITLINSIHKTSIGGNPELKNQLDIESQKVLDYVIYTGNESVLDEFTKDFADYAIGEGNIYYIVGRETNLEAYTYINSARTPIYFAKNEETKEINATIENINYKFDLNDGINFHYVIIEKKGDDRYAFTSE